MHVRGEPVIDRKTHHHPTDDHRRLDRHDHQLDQVPVDQRRAGGESISFGLRHQSRNAPVVDRLARGPAVRSDVGLDRAVGRVEGGQGCADARPVVFQRRHDGFAIIRRNCLAKPVVGGEDARALRELAGVLIQQPREHPLADLQLFGHRTPGVIGDAAANHQKTRALDNQQQNKEQYDDARLQAAKVHRVDPPP